MQKFIYLWIIAIIILLTGFLVVRNVVHAERPYIYQLSDYLNAIEKSKKGEWYDHFRPACQPNEEFRNDACMRGFIMFNLTEALRGMYYVDATELQNLAEYYADTRLNVMFKTRIVEVEKVVEVKTEVSEEDLNKAVKEKLLYLLNQ